MKKKSDVLLKKIKEGRNFVFVIIYKSYVGLKMKTEVTEVENLNGFFDGLLVPNNSVIAIGMVL